jgi:hypothetical protein
MFLPESRLSLVNRREWLRRKAGEAVCGSLVMRAGKRWEEDNGSKKVDSGYFREGGNSKV